MGVSIFEGSKAERIATALEIMAIGNAGGEIEGWAAYRYIVRGGLGPKAAPVGTKLKTKKEASLTATMGVHTGITAVSANEEAFLAAEGIVGSGVYEFVYDGGAWVYNNLPVRIADYGLTVTGTPAAGDEIIVTEAFDVINWIVADYGYVVDEVYIPSSKVTSSTDKSHPAAALIMEHCIYGRAVDANEAAIAAVADMPAGAYKLTIKNQAWYAADENKAFYLTTPVTVPAGGQIKINLTYNAALEGKTFDIYASPESTTSLGSGTVSATAISGAVDLGDTSGVSTDSAKWLVNFFHRIALGSNNYAESALRRWINSDKAANAWYAGSNPFDRPVGYTNAPGLLHGLDADFLNAVRATKVQCKTNNTFELPEWTKNSAYDVKDKFFLPSRDELGYGVENIAEGGVWALYDGAENVDKIKYDLSAQSTARYWWHRSPGPSSGSGVRGTYPSGALSKNGASDGSGAVAACIIW